MFQRFIKIAMVTFFINVPFGLSAQSVLSIPQYAKKNGLSDLFHLAVIAQKCSGLNSALYQFLPDKPEVLLLIKQKAYAHSTDFMLQAALFLNQKGQLSETEIINELQSNIPVISEQFKIKFKKQQLATGNIMDGVVKEEIDFCQSIHTPVKR